MQEFLRALNQKEVQPLFDWLDEVMESPAERSRREYRYDMDRMLDLDGDALMQLLPVPASEGFKGLEGFHARPKYPGVEQAKQATEEWLDFSGPPPNKVGPYLDYLRRRWEEGCPRLELVEMGYGGHQTQDLIHRPPLAFTQWHSYCQPGRHRFIGSCSGRKSG